MQWQLLVEHVLVFLGEYPGFGARVGYSASSGVLEVVDECLLPLQACLGHLADLDAHEIGPLVFVEFLVEVVELGGASHVDEGVAHVATVASVNRKLEKVLATQEVPVDEIQQHRLRVLVWDIFDHEGSALVGRVAHLVAGDVLEVFFVLLLQAAQFLL